VIGIDMPTIVPNAVGYRPCERELAADFRRYHAAPYPANRKRFPDGGRARLLLDALTSDGVSERLDLGPKASGRYAFEVFPHPALVRLFGRSAIFKYKKKPSRSWPSVLEAWREYRAALASLEATDPPLHLPADIPLAAVVRGYKASDDLLDGITCAYVASFLWRWGTSLPHTRIYGNLEAGYIAVPARAVISADRNRGTA
jgi:predicted RNase H-like nuclease